MKKTLVAIALVGTFLFANQSANAWEYTGINSLNPVPYLSYLNPLPYFGIGENKTSFSLNPFTGFKNCKTCKADPCNPCKVKKTQCNECQKAKPICPTCQKAYVTEPPCPCNRVR